MEPKAPQPTKISKALSAETLDNELKIVHLWDDSRPKEIKGLLKEISPIVFTVIGFNLCGSMFAVVVFLNIRLNTPIGAVPFFLPVITILLAISGYYYIQAAKKVNATIIKINANHPANINY